MALPLSTMLMRLIRTRAQPGKWPEFEHDFLSHAPDLKHVPGLRARWILHDLDESEAGFLVALWDCEADAVTFEHAVDNNRLLAQPLPGEVEFHLGEVCSAWVASP